MDEKLIHKLNERIEEGTIRSLSRFEGSIDFCSNDYLGLARFSFGRELAISGSTGSRLISGNSGEAIECETFIAQHFKAEAALIFNSGYDANLGFFGAIPTVRSAFFVIKLLFNAMYKLRQILILCVNVC